MVLAKVELGNLAEVVWVSLSAVVFISVVFSFVVLGGARSAEARRSGHGGAAGVYAGLALLGFLAFAGAVIYGVSIMLSK